MKTKKMLRLGAVVAAVIGLSAPALVSASTGSIDTTGPDSTNKVLVKRKSTTKVQNNNNVNGNLSTKQDAKSGNVSVKKNTTGGDAASGAASNDNATSASVSIDNGSSCGCVGADQDVDHSGDISNTGPYSHNVIKFDTSNKTTITNNNNVNINNRTTQKAKSGDVTVYGNTTAGDATSGDASNSNSTEIMLEISN